MTREPVRIRASSFGSLFDCPARWVAIHMHGMKTPSTGRAVLGTGIHAGTAVFDADRVDGIHPSISAAQDAAVEAIEHPNGEVDWSGDSSADAKDIAASLVRRYCETESPKHEFVAVEATVDSLIITDLAIELTGTTDRIERHADGGLGISDIKSGKTAVRADGTVETKGHGAQMGVYELVAGAAIGQPMTEPARIIGMQTNKTPDKQRIGVGEVFGARDVLLGDGERAGLLMVAAKIVHGEIDAWGNPKSMMCSPKYCPAYTTCFYRR